MSRSGPQGPKPTGTFGATLFYRGAMLALVGIPFLLFVLAAR
jgi:hypothetical protein